MQTPGGPPEDADLNVGEWGRDYFDDAPEQRTRHRITRRELDELCYFVGLLVSSGRWPPARRGVEDPSPASFGLATVAGGAGEVFVHHLHARAAGTRDVAIFFTVLPEQRRIRIVNVISSRRLRSARERAVVVEAAALRAMLAAGLG